MPLDPLESRLKQRPKRRRRPRAGVVDLTKIKKRQPQPARPPGPLMRWDVINALLDLTGQRRFLEIGVQCGICGKQIRANHKTGVDPAPIGSLTGVYQVLHRKPSDEFFRNLPGHKRFDVALVDGLHHADQVLRDVDNVLRHLDPGGTIVLHDCNPATELQQRVPRESGVWNGDCWKAMVRLRQRPDLDAFTIDSDHGIGVVRVRPNPDPLTDVPDELKYEHLEADRERLVGLVSPGQWTERFGPPLALGRVAVVSAIFGGRDEPLPIPEHHDVDDFVMFSDADAPGWDLRSVTLNEDPRRAARRVKALALEEVDADVVVWVDGRVRSTGVPIRPLLSRALTGTDIAGFPHPWRSCAYEEARECAQLGLAEAHAVEAQIRRYQADGFPAHVGLWNTMVLARRRTVAMERVGRAWWDELERHTLRDQISLPYVLWKAGIECGRLGEDVYREGSSDHWLRGWHANGTP